MKITELIPSQFWRQLKLFEDYLLELFDNSKNASLGQDPAAGEMGGRGSCKLTGRMDRQMPGLL